jgi:PAS domain S-box-containing protein
LWERDPETLQIRFINARAQELLGYPTGQWRTDDGLEARILHPDDRDAVLARLRRAVAEDSDFTMSYRARAADGRWLWLQHLGHVARDEAGAAIALHAVLFDVTEQRRREQASALLAAAGQALAADEPVEQRLDGVAGLALPLLGERAVVWLAGDDDRYRMAAAAPAELAQQVRELPPVLAPAQLRPLIAGGRAFTVGRSPRSCAGKRWRAIRRWSGWPPPIRPRGASWWCRCGTAGRGSGC